MRKFCALIVAHRLVIASCIILYLFLAFPVILFPLIAGDSYRGINIPHTSSGNVDSLTYLSAGKEVLDGNFLGNLSLREGKTLEGTNFSLVEFIILAPIKFLGLADRINIVTLYNIYGFFYVVAIVLLIYSFVFRLSKDKVLSTITVVFIIGGYTLIKDKMLGFPEANQYLRQTQPALNIIILFAYLHCLLSVVRNPDKKGRKFVLLSGLFFGLMFYVGFFVWSFALAFTSSLLFIFYFIKKDALLSKRLFFIISLGLLLGAFQLWQIGKFYHSEAGRAASFFFSSARSRAAIYHRVTLLAASVLFVIFDYKYKREDCFWLFFAILLGSWGALNQQVITGVLVQTDHYEQYFIIPLSILISFYIFWFLLKNNKQRLFFGIVVVSLSLSNVALGQFRYMSTVMERRLYEQNYRGVIDYLNNEKNPQVILTDEDSLYNLLFNVYTSHDLFWTPAALQWNTPDVIQRTKNSLCVYLYLNKNSRDYFYGIDKGKKQSYPDPESCCGETYKGLESFESGLSDLLTYRRMEESGDQFIARSKEKTKTNLLATCKNIAGDDERVMEILRKYGVNYIVWDKNLDPNWDPFFINDLKLVFSDKSVDLYRLEN